MAEPRAWPESDVQRGSFRRQPGEVRQDFVVIAGQMPGWYS